MNARPRVETVDVEVIPPGNSRTQGGKSGDHVWQMDALARLIAMFMDSLFKVPATRLRFGMNPFIELLPIFGDGAAAVISAMTLVIAARYQVPKVVLARMGLNILLNASIGVIPVVGEIFAFWFRPTMRNYRMLQKHIDENGGRSRVSTRGDWLFVVSLAGVVLVVFGFCVALGSYFYYKLLKVWI